MKPISSRILRLGISALLLLGLFASCQRVPDTVEPPVEVETSAPETSQTTPVSQAQTSPATEPERNLGSFTIASALPDLGQTWENLIVFWDEVNQTGEVLVFDLSSEMIYTDYKPPVDVYRYTISDIQWVWSGEAEEGTFSLQEQGTAFRLYLSDSRLVAQGKHWMIWENRVNAQVHFEKEYDGAGGRLYGYAECRAHDDWEEEWVFYGNVSDGSLYLVGGVSTEFDQTDSETITWAKQIRDEAFFAS